eukprot:CFRG5477T1
MKEITPVLGLQTDPMTFVSPTPEAVSNPYVETIVKRRRKLIKRLNKISAIEDKVKIGVFIEPDQHATLSKKGAVAATLEELTSLQSSIESVDFGRACQKSVYNGEALSCAIDDTRVATEGQHTEGEETAQRDNIVSVSEESTNLAALLLTLVANLQQLRTSEAVNGDVANVVQTDTQLLANLENVLFPTSLPEGQSFASVVTDVSSRLRKIVIGENECLDKNTKVTYRDINTCLSSIRASEWYSDEKLVDYSRRKPVNDSCEQIKNKNIDDLAAEAGGENDVTTAVKANTEQITTISTSTTDVNSRAVDENVVPDEATVVDGSQPCIRDGVRCDSRGEVIGLKAGTRSVSAEPNPPRTRSRQNKRFSSSKAAKIQLTASEVANLQSNVSGPTNASVSTEKKKTKSQSRRKSQAKDQRQQQRQMQDLPLTLQEEVQLEKSSEQQVQPQKVHIQQPPVIALEKGVLSSPSLSSAAHPHRSESSAIENEPITPYVEAASQQRGDDHVLEESVGHQHPSSYGKPTHIVSPPFPSHPSTMLPVQSLFDGLQRYPSGGLGASGQYRSAANHQILPPLPNQSTQPPQHTPTEQHTPPTSDEQEHHNILIQQQRHQHHQIQRHMQQKHQQEIYMLQQLAASQGLPPSMVYGSVRPSAPHGLLSQRDQQQTQSSVNTSHMLPHPHIYPNVQHSNRHTLTQSNQRESQPYTQNLGDQNGIQYMQQQQQPHQHQLQPPQQEQSPQQEQPSRQINHQLQQEDSVTNIQKPADLENVGVSVVDQPTPNHSDDLAEKQTSDVRLEDPKELLSVELTTQAASAQQQQLSKRGRRSNHRSKGTRKAVSTYSSLTPEELPAVSLATEENGVSEIKRTAPPVSHQHVRNRQNQRKRDYSRRAPTIPVEDSSSPHSAKSA